jgi:Flp pilus assembly protein TadB
MTPPRGPAGLGSPGQVRRSGTRLMIFGALMAIAAVVMALAGVKTGLVVIVAIIAVVDLIGGFFVRTWATRNTRANTRTESDDLSA